MSIDEAPQNKMISADDAVTKDYFVPSLGITVQATSLQDALAKAQAISDNKDKQI